MRVTLVHLSDIHFTVGANAIDSKLKQLAAAVCSTDPLCSHYIAVLSGDLVYNGTADEFQTAKMFVKALERFVTNQKQDATVSWLMVPGNHDCYLPEGEVNLRAALVAAIAPTLQTEAPDNSILESVLAPQRNYFEFCDQLGLPAKGHRRLCDWRTLEIGNAKIRFALYNTALLSTRHEQQGDLSVPIRLIRNSESTDPGSDLVVSVFHHPYPWLQADAGIAFRDHIERSSEIVLTGHQHVEHAYQKQPLTDGGQTLYSEGDVLQEPKAPERSGFRLIHLDTGTQTRKVVSFQWAGSRYSVKEETDWQKYTRVTSLVGQPTPLPGFLELLSDSGIGLTHRSKGPVPLDAVFVYPDVVVSSLSATDIQRDVKGDKLLRYLTEESRVLVRGSAYSGKTSLAKTVVKEWLRTRSFYPVLLSGTQVKHPDQASTDRVLRARTCDIYGDSGYEAYQQLPTSAKALVVDDWDESPLSHAERDKVLQTLLPRFGKVILFVRAMSYIHYVLARVKGTEVILQFDLVSIKELSHVARGDLIEKWLSLEVPRDAKDFSRRVEETERLVQSVIGKNTLPSLPLLILAILEASERNTDVLPENGSFGYLYEVLITSALNSTEGDKPQLDKKYTFLSLLAFQLFDSSLAMLGEGDIHKLIEDYAHRFKVKVDKAALLRDLERTRVLVKEDGNYSFGYNHYFYYFLARYFKNHINGPEGTRLRESLNSIAGGLNSGNNGIFLMFFIYLTHDDGMIDECLRIGDQILAELAPSNLTDEVEFYNSKDFAGVERNFPESIDLEASRRQRRRAADSAAVARPDDKALAELGPDVGSSGYSDSLPLSTKLDYAYRCVEILGQILRNFTGSLPGDRKLSILKTTYLLGLRTLRALLMALSDTTVVVRGEIAKMDASRQEERQHIKRLEKLLTIIGQILGGATVQMISLNVGSPDIEESAYTETLDTVGRNDATELVDLAIRLDHFDVYPFNRIRDLSKRFASNRFAQRVLKDLVVANMHVFDIGYEMRQRVLATLEFGSPGDSALSRASKRLK